MGSQKAEETDDHGSEESCANPDDQPLHHLHVSAKLTKIGIDPAESICDPMVQIVEPRVGPLLSPPPWCHCRRHRFTCGSRNWKMFVACSGALHQARKEHP